MKYNFDCRYFIGEKPCKFKRMCPDCPHYSPMGKRILIVKLGAMGDVLRTTPILSTLKKKYPESHITWITDQSALDLLKYNPLIDILLPFNLENVLRMECETFDLLVNLDKEIRAVTLSEKIKADEKLGFGITKYGTIYPLNTESEYAFDLGLSDQLKFFENKKSYQEIMFEAVKLPYNKEEYGLFSGAKEKKNAQILLKEIGISSNKIIIGISPGAGKVFAKKAWKVSKYIQLIDKLNDEFKNKIEIILLGGTREVEIVNEIKEGVSSPIFDAGCNNSLGDFIGVVDNCHVVISGDTLAMHLAIGLKKMVLAMFGPTCHQEIELYGRGEKVIAKIGCAPCYKGKCDIEDDCMENISLDEVYIKVKDIICNQLAKQ